MRGLTSRFLLPCLLIPSFALPFVPHRESLQIGRGLWVEIPAPKAVLVNSSALEQDLDLPVPRGQVEGAARFRLEASELRLAGTSFRLRRLSLSFAAERWSHIEGPLLRLECRRPSVRYVGHDLEWPLPPRLQADLEVPSDAPASLRLDSSALRDLVDRGLRPLFSADALERNLSFEGDCPGATGRLLAAYLRARLTDLPTKDPALWNQLAESLALRLSEGLEGAFRESFKDWRPPQGLQSRLDLDIGPRVGGQATTWRLVTQGSENIFLPEAAPFRGPLRLTAVPGLLEELGAPSLRRLAKERFLVQELFSAEDLATVLEELAERPPSEPVRIELGLVACESELPLRVRPWLSRDGSQSGVDLEAAALLEVRGPSGILAIRSLPLRAIFEARSLEAARRPDARGAFRWSFTTAEWRAGQRPCGLPSIDEVLGESLNWLLRSESLRELVEAHLAPRLEPFSRNLRKPRVLGQASLDRRRPGGGYYGDAIVIEPLK